MRKKYGSESKSENSCGHDLAYLSFVMSAFRLLRNLAIKESACRYLGAGYGDVRVGKALDSLLDTFRARCQSTTGKSCGVDDTAELSNSLGLLSAYIKQI